MIVHVAAGKNIKTATEKVYKTKKVTLVRVAFLFPGSRLPVYAIKCLSHFTSRMKGDPFLSAFPRKQVPEHK